MGYAVRPHLKKNKRRKRKTLYLLTVSLGQAGNWTSSINQHQRGKAK
jgi:hypothetical protein